MSWLVDAREFLPAFTARPGITNWYVLDDIAAFKAAEKKKKEEKARIRKELADAKEKNKEEKCEQGKALTAVPPLMPPRREREREQQKKKEEEEGSSHLLQLTL